MADFDAFSPQPAEEDPAAEFLAREQSELAGLEDFESAEPAQSQGERIILKILIVWLHSSVDSPQANDMLRPLLERKMILVHSSWNLQS